MRLNYGVIPLLFVVHKQSELFTYYHSLPRVERVDRIGMREKLMLGYSRYVPNTVAKNGGGGVWDLYSYSVIF